MVSGDVRPLVGGRDGGSKEDPTEGSVMVRGDQPRANKDITGCVRA